jgi:hypothetical protein
MSVARPSSAVRGFDARVMVAATAAVVVASVATLRGIPAMLGLLVFVCAGHALVTRGVGATARRLAGVAPFALLVVALNAVLVPGEALLSLAGHRVVSREGLGDGVFFALRLGGMLMAVSVLLAALPEALARAVYDLVRRFRAQRRVAVHFLAMGFVPLFADGFGGSVADVPPAAISRAACAGVGAVHSWLCRFCFQRFIARELALRSSCATCATACRGPSRRRACARRTSPLAHRGRAATTMVKRRGNLRLLRVRRHRVLRLAEAAGVRTGSDTRGGGVDGSRHRWWWGAPDRRRRARAAMLRTSTERVSVDRLTVSLSNVCPRT